MSYNKDTGMYEGYIYKIINNTNNKVYIGQTITTIAHRFEQHISDSKNDKRQYPIYKAIRKYGIEHFLVFELEKLQDESKKNLKKLLDEYEKYYIKKYNSLVSGNGYNLSIGGQASNTCQKRIDQYDMNGNFIKTWNSLTEASDFYQVTKSSISSCCRGKSKSCANYIWRFCGDSFNLYTNTQVVQVKQFSIDGKLLNVFKSIAEASRYLLGNENGISGIVSCCKGKQHIAYGYVWRYIDNNFEDYSIQRKICKINIHKVNCYSLDNQYICTYESVKDATNKLGLKSISSIQESCTNHKKHARNFLWFYADDQNQPDKSKIIV